MRLIDADALIRDLQERYCRPCKASGLDYNGVKCKSCQFDDEIDDIDGFADNSIDIEPKRGKWVPIHNGYHVRCSECGRVGHESNNFCPNCGALMREREGE